MPIKVEIATIERLLYSEEVDIVVAPGGEGVMGILPHHAPLLTTLKVGELLIRKEGHEDIFAIGGGFMEVQPDRIIVLADEAERADEISLEQARAARDRAQRLLEGGDLPPQDLIRVEGELRRAMLKVRLAEKRSHR